MCSTDNRSVSSDISEISENSVQIPGHNSFNDFFLIGLKSAVLLSLLSSSSSSSYHHHRHRHHYRRVFIHVEVRDHFGHLSSSALHLFLL